MFDNYVCIYTTTNIELTGNSYESWCRGFHQIIQYLIRDRFVKGTLVAIRPDIQLQGFELDALHIGHIFEEDIGEIRLSGQRAQTSELRQIDTDGVITLGLGVGESVEFSAWCRGHGQSEFRAVSGGLR